MKQLFLLLALIVGWCVPAFSQPRDFKVKSLRIENGMPYNWIHALLQDKKGYIWTGTENGLAKYNGYQIKVYRLKDENGVEPAYCWIKKIYETPDGELWVSAWGEGLFRYNPGTDNFTKFGFDPYKKRKQKIITTGQMQDYNKKSLFFIGRDSTVEDITVEKLNKQSGELQTFVPDEKGAHYLNASNNYSLYKDAAGRLWLSTNNTLSYYDEIKNLFVPFFTIPESQGGLQFNIIYQHPKDPQHLWITTVENNRPANVFYISTADKSFKTFGKDDSGSNKPVANATMLTINVNDKKVVFCTDSGLSVFNYKDTTIKNYFPDGAGAVELAVPDANGNVWCRTKDGQLLFFNASNGIFSSYMADQNDKDALPKDFYRFIMTDRTGGVWLGTTKYGLLLLNTPRSVFSYYNQQTNSNYPQGTVISLNTNDGNLFYLLTNQRKLFTWDKAKNLFAPVSILPKAQEYAVINLFIDRSGTVWLGTYGMGLYSYNPKTKLLKQYGYNETDKETISSNNIYCVFEDKKGIIWVGTNGGGICSLNPQSGKFTRYPFTNNTGSTANKGALDYPWVLTIFEDHEGTIWVGTNNGEINKLDQQTQTFTSFYDTKTEFMGVNSIYEDRKGHLWAGTDFRGVYLIDRNHGFKKRFTEAEGLVFNYITGMQGDTAGNIWITTLRGLSKFNPDTYQFTNYTTATGLPENNLNVLVPAKDGDIVIGADYGIISFNPADIKPNLYPPQIVIESLSYSSVATANGQEQTQLVDSSTHYHFAYNQNRIKFNFVALHYTNASLNTYAYKLEGLNNDWVNAGTEHTITFNNLNPGTYRFLVKAANSDGVWNENPVSVTFTISPPWWRTWWAYLLYAVALATVIGWYINFRSRKLKKANVLLEQKVADRTNQLQQSIEELTATQKQLIQSEKMASLGELTAGIAHEIQNPLNFVNNFSEVSTELVEELKSEKAKVKSERDEELENEIIDDIQQNLEKINHHGKRADAIVKGMLQHSRTSSGKKEPTDINALADEYLRLSYHGLRAKDKSFNADFKTDFDETIGMIEVMPQDFGRVLLNLYNNAFYAVNEKKKQYGETYKPLVSVSTKKLNNKIEISVMDNGTGIPQKAIDKIFQPFFTTKPTGQGTGLGLSLSYDIIKAHGGELKVKTEEGEGAEFIILLPAAGSH